MVIGVFAIEGNLRDREVETNIWVGVGGQGIVSKGCVLPMCMEEHCVTYYITCHAIAKSATGPAPPAVTKNSEVPHNMACLQHVCQHMPGHELQQLGKKHPKTPLPQCVPLIVYSKAGF